MAKSCIEWMLLEIILIVVVGSLHWFDWLQKWIAEYIVIHQIRFAHIVLREKLEFIQFLRILCRGSVCQIDSWERAQLARVTLTAHLNTFTFAIIILFFVSAEMLFLTPLMHFVDNSQWKKNDGGGNILSTCGWWCCDASFENLLTICFIHIAISKGCIHLD